MRILMVDDDRIGMEGLQELLEDDGHKVDFAPEPDTATSKLSSNDYAFLILDIMFPYGVTLGRAESGDTVRTGIALLGRIRRNEYERNKDIRVLVYTAKAGAKDLLDQLAELGVDKGAFFQKPGKALEIVDYIARLP